MTWLLVVLGAAAGAPLRYAADRAVQARHLTAFPWGTCVVNVLGCLVLGALVGATDAGVVGPSVRSLLGTGLCGAFTTYSTFSYETLRLWERGRTGLALANVLVSVLAGLGAAALGLISARWLAG